MAVIETGGLTKLYGRKRGIEDVTFSVRPSAEAIATLARPPSRRCSCYAAHMTLHQTGSEVGVRELHDRLSEYLERVEGGGEIVVTRRGRRIARLSGLGADEQPLEDLARRGLVRMPQEPRSSRPAQVKSTGSVSDLVSEQRA